MTFTLFFTLFSMQNLFADELLSEQLESLKTQEPQEYLRRSALMPRPTRAGHLWFVGSELSDPAWAPLYIDRYLNQEEPTNVRRALLYLIYRSLNHIPEEMVALFADEPAILRADIIEHIPYDRNLTETATRDESSLVRAALARKAGSDLQLPEETVLLLLQDKDTMVQMDAARAAYRRNCTTAIPLLKPLISQKTNGTLALRALYALSKLDMQLAIRTVKKHQLTQSPHRHLAIFSANLLGDSQ